MKNIKKYLTVVLLIVGQVVAVCSIIQESTAVMWIGIALSAFAAGLWARKTGRSVFGWFFLSLFPVIGPIVVLAAMLLPRRCKSEGTQKPVNIYIHVIVASILFFLGSIVLNSTVFVMTGFVLAVASVAKGLKDRHLRKKTLGVVGIYILMLTSAIVLKSVNNHVSHKNANAIIVACDEYKEKKGTYPLKLGDLTPGYLTRIPRARYTMYSNEFKYNCGRGPNDEEVCRLMFVEESPFARNVYDLTSRSWSSLD